MEQCSIDVRAYSLSMIGDALALLSSTSGCPSLKGVVLQEDPEAGVCLSTRAPTQLPSKAGSHGKMQKTLGKAPILNFSCL